MLKSKKEKSVLKCKFGWNMNDSSKTATAKISSILSISHDKDVDGLNAAAIVWRYAKSKDIEYNVVLTDYGS